MYRWPGRQLVPSLLLSGAFTKRCRLPRSRVELAHGCSVCPTMFSPDMNVNLPCELSPGFCIMNARPFHTGCSSVSSTTSSSRSLRMFSCGGTSTRSFPSTMVAALVHDGWQRADPALMIRVGPFLPGSEGTHSHRVRTSHNREQVRILNWYHVIVLRPRDREGACPEESEAWGCLHLISLASCLSVLCTIDYRTKGIFCLF